MDETKLKELFKIFQGHSVEHAASVEKNGKTLIGHIMELGKNISKDSKLSFIDEVEKTMWSIDSVEDRQRMVERLQELRQRIRRGDE